MILTYTDALIDHTYHSYLWPFNSEISAKQRSKIKREKIEQEKGRERMDVKRDEEIKDLRESDQRNREGDKRKKLQIK